MMTKILMEGDIYWLSLLELDEKIDTTFILVWTFI